jgi:hypothetical protein
VSHFDQITRPPDDHNYQEANPMRVLWEQRGVLLPIDRLAGQGLSDGEIASKQDIAESKSKAVLHGCCIS